MIIGSEVTRHAFGSVHTRPHVLCLITRVQPSLAESTLHISRLKFLTIGIKPYAKIQVPAKHLEKIDHPSQTPTLCALIPFLQPEAENSHIVR